MKTLIKLMDIKTLVAGIIPVIFGSVYSLYKYDAFNYIDMLILMFGIILVQSSTNMINDLFDYHRGADGDSKSDEKALASGEVDHKTVLKIVIIFISMAMIISIYYSITRHYSIFIITVISASIIYFYSAGKHPISYTAFGELVAGSTMGFGIMTTVIYIQSGVFNLETILVVIPTALYIGNILLTNNISDHHEDIINGRRTLPIVIGIKNAQALWINNCFLLVIVTIVLVMMNLLPIESVILAIIVLPYKEILNFRHIPKEVKNKGIMMGLISQIGMKFHIALVTGLLMAIFIRPLIMN